MAGLNYVNIAKPKEPAAYTPVKNTVQAYTPGTYQSQYQGQLDNALNTVTNWKYNPLEDASYQALAKVYGARGNIAAKNTLADAAALNGGYGTSYAVSAAQQARNQYNQELAALIPDLENAAYSRATGTLSALRDADNTAYGRFRDTESDKQWQYTQAYQAWRDATADAQWLYNQNYQKYRDLLSDWQWGLNYDLDIYNMKQAAASGGGGGGGGRRRSGGGGGGSYGGSSSGSSGSAQYGVANAAGSIASAAASYVPTSVSDALKKFGKASSSSSSKKSGSSGGGTAKMMTK